jgi:hypothetical protein
VGGVALGGRASGGPGRARAVLSLVDLAIHAETLYIGSVPIRSAWKDRPTMELTPERKQQIEEEERQLLEEEQYRAQVRASLNATPGPSLPPSTPRAPEPEQRKSHVGLLLGILAVVIVGVVILINRNSARTPASDTPGIASAARTPSVRYVPVDQKIASGQIVVRAKGYEQYRFQITPEMRNVHVTGQFNASGGTGNDIEAIIATEVEFTNWVNGHQARVFYSTQGKKTTDTFNVSLAPGTYYLAFSNRFSALTSKDVFLEVDLNYQRIETY